MIVPDERKDDAARSVEGPTAAPSLQSILRRIARAVVFLTAFVAVLVPTVYWVEAEKEAHILCGMARLGVPQADILRLFDTAALLRVETERRGDTHELRAATPAPVGHEHCVIAMRDGTVASVSWSRTLPTLSIATLALLLSIPVAWLLRSRRNAKASLTAAVGVVLLAAAALQRAGVAQLAIFADLSTAILATALLTQLALASWHAATAHTARDWARVGAATVIALCCSILLLSPPTP